MFQNLRERDWAGGTYVPTPPESPEPEKSIEEIEDISNDIDKLSISESRRKN